MTTTDLETFHESSLNVLPPARRQSDTSIAMLTAHAEMMHTAYSLAVKMVTTSLVPQRFRGKEKADDATAAILYGLELGLNPIQSLQRIIPIHGMPSLEARTMVALLQSRGYKVKTRAQSDASVTVFGRDLDGDEYETTWTIDRAIQAGYVPKPSSDKSLRRPDIESDWLTVSKTWDGKTKTSVLGNMKYITDPQAMLKAKAQSEVCREIAPEVLLGIGYTREDLESENWGEDTTPRRVPSSRDTAFDVDQVEDDIPAQQKLGDKIKPAAAQPESEPEPEDTEPEAETAPEPAGAPETAPGAPTAATPGQTERVAAALNQAQKGGAAKALADMIDTLLAKLDVTDTDDIEAVAAQIIGDEYEPDKHLTLAQLKTVHDTLLAWRDLDTIDAMVTNAINTADAAKDN